MRGSAVPSPFVIWWKASGIIKWWRIAHLVSGISLKACLRHAAWKQEWFHKWSDSHPPPNRPWHQVQVCKQSRLALCPGRRNAEVGETEWSVTFSQDLFFYHQGRILNISSTAFLSEAANCIRDLSLQRRKMLFPRTRKECRAERRLELRSLPCESWVLSSTQHSWACPPGEETWPAVVPRSEEPLGSSCPESWQQGVSAHRKPPWWGLSIQGRLV